VVKQKGLKKVGLPPGSLAYAGNERKERVRIKVFYYDKNKFEERDVKSDEIRKFFPLKDRPGVTWINVNGVHDVRLIEEIGKNYGLHKLVLEDIVNTEQRPKANNFGDYLFIVLKMFSRKDKRIEVEQVSFVLGKNFVISFQEREGDVFDPVRERIRNEKSQIRRAGPDSLLHSLIDAIVDNYLVLLEKLGGEIEILEDALVSGKSKEAMEEIHRLKVDLIRFRKAVWPWREAFSSIEMIDTPLLRKATRIYFRDVYENVIQAIDTIETYREMLSGMLEIYLTSASNRMNEIMKMLTIIATIFVPLTFITGIYGMNFANMPELRWYLGYPMILLFMLAIGISMLVYFRRRKWL